MWRDSVCENDKRKKNFMCLEIKSKDSGLESRSVKVWRWREAAKGRPVQGDVSGWWGTWPAHVWRLQHGVCTSEREGLILYTPPCCGFNEENKISMETDDRMLPNAAGDSGLAFIPLSQWDISQITLADMSAEKSPGGRLLNCPPSCLNTFND